MIKTAIYFYTIVAVIIASAGIYQERQTPLKDYQTAILFGMMWPVMAVIVCGFFIDKRVTS
jgi:hypothetical protein